MSSTGWRRRCLGPGWSLRRLGLLRPCLGGRLLLCLQLLLHLDQLSLAVEDLLRLGAQLLHVDLSLPELVQEVLAQLVYHLAPLLAQGVYL